MPPPIARPRRPLSSLAGVALLAVVAAAAGGRARGDGPPPPGAATPAAPAAPAAPGAPAPPEAPAAPRVPADRAAERAWLEEAGTAVLGFGLLRVAPTTPGTPGALTLRYEERPGDYAAFDAVQLVVLSGDAFAEEGRAFADRALAFGRSAGGVYAAEVTIEVKAPALVVVGYGPFTGPDTGRPLTLARAYTLEVTKAIGVSRAWIDAEAGELQVKGWTNRPEILRGGPVKDPVTSKDHWFEVRPEILYDRARLRTEGDPETPETAARRREADTLRSRAKDLDAAGKADAAADLRREADDVLANLVASDDRIPLPKALAERLRRLPFRWK